ncbi:MAG: hypothetical protein ACI4RP_09375 [Acutalibacteraceae bacterium]
MKSSAKAGRILIFALSLVMAFSLCSCNEQESSSPNTEAETVSDEGGIAPKAYQFEGVSVDSITAVVGSKAYEGFSTSSTTHNGNSNQKTTYTYQEIFDSDIEAYGEYLLQNGFEEIQTNVFSKSTQEGVTMKITLNDNSVIVEGEIVKQS